MQLLVNIFQAWCQLCIATFPWTHHRWRIQALIYITDDRSLHTPRAVRNTSGVCRHGLGLSWNLSWSRNRPVFRELWTPPNYCAMRGSVIYMATYPCIHHLWRTEELLYVTAARSSHTSRAVRKIAEVHMSAWGRAIMVASWRRNGPVFHELWAPLKYCMISRSVMYQGIYIHISSCASPVTYNSVYTHHRQS